MPIRAVMIMRKMRIEIHKTVWSVKLTKGKKLDDGTEMMYLGRTYYKKHLIRIRAGLDEPNLVQTLRHELTHAYLFEYGIHLTDEESICDFIGAFGREIADRADMIAGYLDHGKK